MHTARRCPAPVRASSVRAGSTAAESVAPIISTGSQLDALRAAGTKIVLDSGELDLLRINREKWSVVDTTTNPSLVLKAAGGSGLMSLAKKAVELAGSRPLDGDRAADDAGTVAAASEIFSVLLGVGILKEVPGRISTETDARIAHDKDDIISQARHNTGTWRPSSAYSCAMGPQTIFSSFTIFAQKRRDLFSTSKGDAAHQAVRGEWRRERACAHQGAAFATHTTFAFLHPRRHMALRQRLSSLRRCNAIFAAAHI